MRRLRSCWLFAQLPHRRSHEEAFRGSTNLLSTLHSGHHTCIVWTYAGASVVAILPANNCGHHVLLLVGDMLLSGHSILQKLLSVGPRPSGAAAEVSRWWCEMLLLQPKSCWFQRQSDGLWSRNHSATGWPCGRIFVHIFTSSYFFTHFCGWAVPYAR